MYEIEINEFVEKISNMVCDIDDFEDKMNDCVSWKKYFLCSGYPEIIFYILQVKDMMPEEKFGAVLESYVKRFKDELSVSRKYLNSKAGIIYGYCGIGCMLLELKKIGVKIDKLLNSINKFALKVVNKKLEKAEDNLINSKVCYEDYDVLSGVSSALRYLIKFKEDTEFKVLIKRIIKYLIKLTDKNKEGYPNYYIKPDNLDELRRERNPNGIIDYGVAHGIAGILSSLSIAKIHGIEVEGMDECILNILNELENSRKCIKGINYWPNIVNIDDYLNNNFNVYNTKDYGWCYGVLGTARAVYLGGQALKRQEDIDIAINTFKMISSNRKEINIITYIICHGYSGVLVLLNEMYGDTKEESIKATADFIVGKILGWLNETELLKDVTHVESRGEGRIDLWEGIIGIALALLNYNDSSKNLISKLMTIR